jgi:hypothetical protein
MTGSRGSVWSAVASAPLMKTAMQIRIPQSEIEKSRLPISRKGTIPTTWIGSLFIRFSQTEYTKTVKAGVYISEA